MLYKKQFNTQIKNALGKNLDPKYFVLIQWDEYSLELREIKEYDFNKFKLHKVQNNPLIPRVVVNKAFQS